MDKTNMQESRNLTWRGEKIFMDIDGNVSTKIEDHTLTEGFREIKLHFEEWDEPMGADFISISQLYEDIFPEFVKRDGKKILLDIETLIDIFPETKFVFNINDEYIFKKTIKEVTEEKEEYKEKKAKKKAKQPAHALTGDQIEQLKKELKNDIIRDLVKNFHLVPRNKDNNNTIAQKEKNGDLVEVFLNANDASRKTGIAAPSISACINGKRKSAGGYVWKKII